MIPSAVHEAVLRDSADALRRLLAPSAPTSPDALSAALTLAAGLPCRVDTAAALLDAGADPERSTALVAACQQPNRDCPELARLLLARGARPDQTSRPDGKPALLLAVHRGHVGLARQLLQSGADANRAEPVLGWTPLLAAARLDRLDLAQLLLDAGADANVMCSGTALAMAASQGHTSLVRLLLEHRADPNLVAPPDPDSDPDADPDEIDSYAPLAYAASNGHRECAELLLRAGARPDAATSALGRTPLILAALHGHAGVVVALLKAGADPNLAELRHRWTPLVTAVHTDAVDVTEALLADKRTDVDRLTDDGTALAKAAEAGNVAMVTRLLTAGANADKADETDGHTPLMWAAQAGHVAAIEHLISRGARPGRVNLGDQSAILLAAINGHEAALAQLLRSPNAAERERAIRAAQEALVGEAGRRLDRSLFRRISGILEAAQDEVVDNQSNNLVAGFVSAKQGRSVRDSSGAAAPAQVPGAVEQIGGTLTRLVSNQTVLPPSFLQSLNILRETLEFLNKGHFGCVYRAQDSAGRYLVLKVVSAPFRPNQAELARTVSEANRREVELMQAMKHRNIVQFYSAQLVPGSLIICMEYIQGENLRLHRERLGSIPESMVVNYLGQICRGLDYVHNLNICHRDVKCENLMLQMSSGLVKIIDFGLSKRIHATEVYHSGVGTLLWMAPEVLLHAEDMTRRRRRYDPMAADVYSLGCSLHELCTGVPPLYSQEGPVLAQLLYHARRVEQPLPVDAMQRCRFSPSLCSFYTACVAKNPTARPTLPQLLSHPVFSRASNLSEFV